MPTSHDLQRYLDVAVEAAVAAGRITLQYFQTNTFTAETKADSSPVTIADRKSEELIAGTIRRNFPGHGIVGEESGESTGTEPVRWIIDPLDGTKTFIRGVPFYGVMIGVEIEGRVEAGVVQMPALGETYYAARGSGSFRNGERLRVSETARLDDALLLTTDVAGITKRPAKEAGFQRLLGGARMFRTWGDCYGHLLVASGRAEIMLDAKMSIWDSAALAPIVGTAH